MFRKTRACAPRPGAQTNTPGVRAVAVQPNRSATKLPVGCRLKLVLGRFAMLGRNEFGIAPFEKRSKVAASPVVQVACEKTAHGETGAQLRRQNSIVHLA